MNRRDKHIYIGVDVHKQQHTAVIVNCWGEKLGDITFKNKPAAFPEFIKEIERHSKKDMTPCFWIGRCRGTWSFVGSVSERTRVSGESGQRCFIVHGEKELSDDTEE